MKKTNFTVAVEDIKSELTRIYGVTDFSDFDFFESVESLVSMLQEYGYESYGDAFINRYAVEKFYTELKRIYWDWNK